MARLLEQAGLIKISSADGSGDYVENLRTLDLYYSAAQSRGTLPGSQAGVANLFTFSQDQQDWYPAGYWFGNLRMQIQANMTAGVPSLNDPIFRLYQNNVANIGTWTSARMPGKQGLCVPETMRYNGNGYYAGGDAARNASCDSTIAPSYNSLTTTTGAEIGLWAWQHYQLTDDQAYLRASYPLMSGAARFLLSAGTAGSDGLLHTRSNAHETRGMSRTRQPTSSRARRCSRSSSKPRSYWVSTPTSSTSSTRRSRRSRRSRAPTSPPRRSC